MAIKPLNLKQWCKKNGHNGVTKECLLSAIGSEDEKVKEWAKEAMIRNTAKESI